MAKAANKKSTKRPPFMDFSPWNFIIFLVLGFILIVFIANALQKPAKDLSAKAGLTCPDITTLPRPEDCPGGTWVYGRDPNTSCPTFSCPSN